MDNVSKKFYQFDDFYLDAAECQLKRQGELVPLPPKVFDVLLVMVENQGRILDKEFLHRTLWPDTFVEDGTLTQYVFLLRKALQEDTAGHRYIETVPRRGYRFVAPVQEVTGIATAANGWEQKQNGTPTLNETKNGPLKTESHIVLANLNGAEQQTLATRKRPDYFDRRDGVAWSLDGKTLACERGFYVNDVVLMSDFLPT